MDNFRYIHAPNEATAIHSVKELEAHEKCKFLAGGTNLIDLMKLQVETPTTLIDISSLPLSEIKVTEHNGIHVGALVTNSDLAHHSEIKNRFPLLSQALLLGASVQLRNMATVGGNLLQRTRCTFFNDVVFPCNKRIPNSGCPALKGNNRNLALLGTSESCIATNPSDMNVALAAIDPIIHVKSIHGDRKIQFSKFHLQPHSTPHIETALNAGDLITGIELPHIPWARRSYYIKVRDRASYEFALVSVAVILDIQKDIIQNVRIAAGGVGTVPWRAHEAEKILIGSAATEENFKKAAEAELSAAKTTKYNSFKVTLAQRTIVRALNFVKELNV